MSAEHLPDTCSMDEELKKPSIQDPSIVETDPESDAELFEDAVEDLNDVILKTGELNVSEHVTVHSSEHDVSGLKVIHGQDHDKTSMKSDIYDLDKQRSEENDKIVEEILSENLDINVCNTGISGAVGSDTNTENGANKTDECKSQESCLDENDDDSEGADGMPEDEEGEETKKKWDDGIDEESMKELEAQMTDEEKQEKKDESQTLKKEGNDLFKESLFEAAISTYTAALRICPLCFVKERSVLYSNRAACKYRLEDHENSIDDCSKALELNSSYLKALLRRAECYEKTDKLDEALADYQKVVEMDPSQIGAREACMRLPDQIKERNEKMKEEMMGKLKDLGNLVLRPFGLSTENFKFQQDPNTGGYSVNFVQGQQQK